MSTLLIYSLHFSPRFYTSIFASIHLYIGSIVSSLIYTIPSFIFLQLFSGLFYFSLFLYNYAYTQALACTQTHEIILICNYRCNKEDIYMGSCRSLSMSLYLFALQFFSLFLYNYTQAPHAHKLSR